ncbi:MAG: twin-arginine translocase TatA/TatE family subunit [Micavibrio sp.]|nr:twin-arginine translocase TatA/TatE family subunit [Micavibrio sp.]
MGLSFGHIIIVLVIVLVLFGAGKLPAVMGDLGKGLRSFKDGLKGEEEKSKTEILPPSDHKGE